MIVDELIAVLGYETKGEGELKRFQASIDQTAKRITMFAAAAGVAAAGALAALGKSVITVSAKFESYAATLETIEGSSEKAEKALDWISDFAKKTPYDVAELTEAFVKLRAYGMDPTTGLLEDLGNASSAMGKGLMSAVEMIADASTGEFERLKEFGIRASQEGKKVTFSWTENGKQLSKTVNKTSDEITKFIRDRFGSRFSGAMVRQSKTWNGMISNLGDTWVDFQRRIGDAGFFESAKRGLGLLIDYFGRLDANGTLDRFAKGLGSALETGVNSAIFLTDRLRRHFEYLSQWFSVNPELFKAIAIGLGLIAAVKFPFLASLFIIEDFLSWLEGGSSLIGDFAEALSKLTGVDNETLGVLFATLAGATVLTAAAASIGVFTSSLWPLAAALAAVAGGFALAKSALEYFDAKGANIKAVDNPKSKPGYIESAGYDEDGKFIYMTGANRHDRPAENPQDGFTKDALDWKNLMENLEGNSAKMGGGVPANAVVNDNKQDNRNQSVTVQVGGVVVQGVPNVSAAVGGAVGQAVGQAAVGRASRFEKDDAF